jgi:bifunctional UDP-N-acetylglucosamine pyrophosphorylase/glucosamine-1-phosphate N-acetyltransferase
MTQQLQAVVLAAGLGTRMKSRKAKVLHEAAGQALVEHVLDAVAGSGIASDQTIVVVGHQADKVQQLLAPRGCRFVLQAEQKGTGHAVGLCAGEASHQGHTVILYGDCPLLTAATIRRLVAAQQAHGSAATVVTAILGNPFGYGRILRGSDGGVVAIVEEKAATAEQRAVREINSGIYCVKSDLLWKHVAAIRPNAVTGEIYLTDLVENLVAAGERVEGLILEDPSEIEGINDRVQLAAADAVLRARKARQLMLAGVTIEQPETVRIDTNVKVGIDSIIGPLTQLLGNTTIGENCRIGAGSIVRDSQIGDEVTLGEYCLVGTSTIENGARLGPLSRLREANHVGAGAQIGNFVELKKTRLGAGSKAMHLAYLGDADIGAGVNIGAGAITCNYDGSRKHRTIIGDGAFVGSNSTIVAPVEIAAGSYVGAGSVITEKVPAGALALGRSRQVVKPDWARRRRDQ